MAEPDFPIDLSPRGLFINAERIAFPVPVTLLEHLFGPARFTQKKYNKLLTWDELGIFGYSDKIKWVHIRSRLSN